MQTKIEITRRLTLSDRLHLIVPKCFAVRAWSRNEAACNRCFRSASTGACLYGPQSAFLSEKCKSWRRRFSFECQLIEEVERSLHEAGIDCGA